MEAQGEGELSNIKVFLTYFIPAILLISILLNRVEILRASLRIVIHISNYLKDRFLKESIRLNTLINTINAQQFVYFAKRDNIAILNKVVLYIKNNENTRNLKIVHVVDSSNADESEFIKSFRKVVEIIDEEYPEIDVKGEILQGKFGPDLIKKLSKQWEIPINFMFIASPGDHFPYRVEELGGVRLII